MDLDPASFKGLSRFLAPSAGGPLADRALGEKLISLEQLEECVREQDRTGRPLDEILVERGFLKQEEVTRLKAPPLPPEVVEAASDPLRILDHYVLVSLLGKGGMAEVWKAWDRSLGRWVAVKYLRPDIGHPTQRIEREGRMAGAFSHPGIISIFERGLHHGRPYLVMPFVDGSPPRAPLPPREAARVAHEVAQALAHVHERGVIHRDVKPANILIADGGYVVLADFGLAIPDDLGTSRWAVSGTPEYASPEQVRGDVLDARTDIYSLGATLYHLLSGHPPFSGRDPEEIGAKVLRGQVEPLRGIPSDLRAAVRKAMALERADRYATMEEFDLDVRGHLERARRGPAIRPRLLAILLAIAMLPWALTAWLYLQGRAREAQDVYKALREAERELSAAEQARGDPKAGVESVARQARSAASLFRRVLEWSEGKEPEAHVGLGRCLELEGEIREAEIEYGKAGTLPSANLALARLWTRRLLEERPGRDWKSLVRGRLAANHPLRAYVEARWEDVLAGDVPRSDDVLALARGVAAIKLGRWEEAVREIDVSLRLNGDDATTLYYLGIAREGRGDKAAAAAAWRESLEKARGPWPLRPEAQKRLNALKP